MISIPINELSNHIGELVIGDIAWGGKTIVKSGEVITEELIKFLEEEVKNINFIRVKKVCDGLSKPEGLLSQLNAKVKHVLKAYSFDNEEDTAAVAEIMEILLENLYENEGLDTLDLDELLLKRPTLCAHSIDVAILSTLLAIKSGKFQRWMLEQVTLGALLHDIGLVPLVNNCTDGTRPSFAEISNHPAAGYELLQNNSFIPEAVKKIVLMHHVWEQPDDSFDIGLSIYRSYPYEYKGSKFQHGTKTLSVGIVQVADVFVSLTSSDPFGTTPIVSKKEAITKILNDAERIYGEAATLLATYISPYSVGDRVLLNNGKYAIIDKQTSSPLNPIVHYEGKSTQIDLRKKPFTHIKN